MNKIPCNKKGCTGTMVYRRGTGFLCDTCAHFRRVRLVKIPACAEHEGLRSVHVLLSWVCPVCGAPRGEPHEGRSYDGSRILYCDTWENPCGHIDKYENVRQEAKANGLN